METKRRRIIQNKFNIENNITPTTIAKNISSGVIETLRGTKKKRSKIKKSQPEKTKEINLSVKEIEEEIKVLKVRMKDHAKNLEFEEAAKLRDEIKLLSDARLLI